MKLGQKIAFLRKKNQMSQEELAEKMHVSRQAVSKWESEQSLPDIDKIVDLSELFGVSTDYLLKNGAPSFDIEQVKSRKLPVKLTAISDQELANYDAAGSNIAKTSGLAFSFLGLACAGFCFWLGFSKITIYNLAALGGIVTFLIFFALASSLLVHNFLIMREFKQIRNGNFALTQEQVAKSKSAFAAFRKKQNKKIVAATICTILALIPPFIPDMLLLPHYLLIDWKTIFWGFTFLFLSIAVYLFISYYAKQKVFTTLIMPKHRQVNSKNRHLLITYTALYWLFYLLIWWLLRQLSVQYPFIENSSIFFLALVIYGICYFVFFYRRPLK